MFLLTILIAKEEYTDLFFVQLVAIVKVKIKIEYCQVYARKGLDSQEKEDYLEMNIFDFR